MGNLSYINRTESRVDPVTSKHVTTPLKVGHFNLRLYGEVNTVGFFGFGGSVAILPEPPFEDVGCVLEYEVWNTDAAVLE